MKDQDMRASEKHALRRALAAAVFEFPPPPPAPGDPICRGCGCWEWNACLHGDGEPCDWVEEDLCSVCAARMDAAAARAGSGFQVSRLSTPAMTGAEAGVANTGAGVRPRRYRARLR